MKCTYTFLKKHWQLLLLILIYGCNHNTKKDTFNLFGSINGDYSGYIYLNYLNTKDSVRVINSKFSFGGLLNQPTMSSLHLEGRSDICWLYIENSTIDVEIDFKKILKNDKPFNSLKTKQIIGSKSEVIKNEYQDFFQANKSKKDFDKRLYDKLNVFLKKNSEHPFSGALLGELALINPILSKDQLIQLYKIIDTTKQNEEDLKMFRLGIKKMEKYGVGNSFPEFELTDVHLEKVNKNDYLGKVTLIDFWASWCVPCRLKHPELIKLKEQFKDKNFDILSVSIDDDNQNWKTAIDQDQLTWTNVLDENKRIYNELGIIAIPYNYLVDEDGNILKVNASMEDLKTFLTKKI